MTPKLFLSINGFGYVVLGLICAFAPFWSAQLVGFELLGGNGLAEFIAVYGGLEVALGIFFLLCRQTEERTRTGLLFGVCLYSCLVLFRVSGMVMFSSPTSDIGWVLFGLEVTFMILSMQIWARNRATGV